MKYKKKSVIPILFIALIICIIASGLFVYHVKPGHKVSHPVYEEGDASSNKLKAIIGRIDHCVYEALYKEGVNADDIFFSKVVPKHENDFNWDFIELTVLLPNSEAVNRLGKIIASKLSDLQSAVLVEKEEVSADQLLYHIKTSDLYTHRIILAHNKVKKNKAKVLPRVAIIIDDIGYDRSLATSFMDIGIPICLSLLPGAPYTQDIAAEAGSRGNELLLHLPMEPKGYPDINPGQDALMTYMDRETIHNIVRRHVMAIPGIKGVNHHMGSLFSEDYIKMKYVLNEIKKHDLYYVDSRTTNLTVAYKVAKEAGVPAAKKSLFIDNDLSEKALKYQMERLLGMARYSGKAIGIGHPHRETLNILKKYAEQLSKDYDVVYISELVD